MAGESDGDRRVEPRQLLVGSGHGTTPERIAEIERRRAEIERARPTEPAVPFSQVLKSSRKKRDPDDEELDEKEKRLKKLPKKGPRPSLLHPSQRDAYGRDDDSDDPIVLKG